MTLTEQKVNRYKDEIAGLADTLPNVARAYHQFTGEIFASGELDERTKQLIALGIALYANNEICTLYHVEEARSKGATERQILEAASVAAAAASGHVMSQSVTRVQGAADSVVHAASTTMDGGAAGMQDYLQDSEFANEWISWDANFAGGQPVSPSY